MADQSRKSDKPSQGIFGIFTWPFGGGGETATTQEVETPGPEKEELSEAADLETGDSSSRPEDPMVDQELSKEQVLSKFNSELSIEEFNIFIVGCSGEGKSTLINEIFGENLAKIGQFIPTTMKIEKFTKKDIPFSLYDTRGLELIEFKQIKEELLNFVKEKQNKKLSERLHAA